MINELRASILSKLEEIENIAEVYDGIPSSFTGFPSIFFNFDRVESSVLDSNHHERIYYFIINIFQEVSTLSVKEGEKNLCDILDEIISIFDRSDLDELALKIDAVGGNINSVEIESWPALHAVVVLGIHSDFRLN